MKCVTQLVQEERYQDFIARTQRLEESRIYCRHTFQHMLDVARITYILMLEANEFSSWLSSNRISSPERGKEIVYMACLLHDIGRWEQYETGESHAEISARYARRFLESLDFYEKEIEIIETAIREHRSSCTPKTQLSRYLQRADKLSRPCWQCRARTGCKEIATIETRDFLLY